MCSSDLKWHCAAVKQSMTESLASVYTSDEQRKEGRNRPVKGRRRSSPPAKVRYRGVGPRGPISRQQQDNAQSDGFQRGVRQAHHGRRCSTRTTPRRRWLALPGGTPPGPKPPSAAPLRATPRNAAPLLLAAFVERRGCCRSVPRRSRPAPRSTQYGPMSCIPSSSWRGFLLPNTHVEGQGQA